MADDQDILTGAAADYAAGRFEDAADKFRDVLSRHPDLAELYINLGAALRGCGNLSGAEDAYRAAIKRTPETALAWFNLGNVLQDLNRNNEALAAYMEADRLQPGTPEILSNIGVQRYAAGDIDGALDAYAKSLDVEPDFPDALINRGNARQRLGLMEAAEDDISRALQIDPENSVYRLNMSAFMAANGRYSDALSWADKAIKADPAYVKAKLKKASLLIQQGELEKGFQLYEARWEQEDWHPLPASTSVPMWSGEDLAGKHLVVWNEQGFGDALMYARFLPPLADAAETVTFICERPLHPLFQSTFGKRIDVCDIGAIPENADLHVSIMSLPYLLKTELGEIYRVAPYLQPPRDRMEAWREKLDAVAPSGLRIGLIWAGNPKQDHDYARSIPDDIVTPLLGADGVHFFNLLIGPRGDEIDHPHVIDVRREIADFSDTAAIMRNLDLIISVDSAPAHLAGSIGVPVWILLAFDPDSRYFLERSDSPWYATARLFRQKSPGDWAQVIDTVGTELGKLARN